MNIEILRDKTREELFFIINRGIGKFNDLKRKLNLQSNELTYHIKKLISANLIEKTNSKYYLTEQGKNIFPFRKSVTQKEMPAMAVVAVIILDKDQVFMRIKDNEPWKGTIGFLGGTIRHGEDIFKAAERKAMEECNATLSNLRLRGISDTKLYGKKEIKQHWLVYIFTAKSKNPKNGKWYSLKKLPNNLFIDNKYFLTHVIKSKKLKYYQLVFDEAKKNNAHVIRVVQ